MFKALIGDIFQSKAQTLVNTINCVGVMGKGVALEFKKRFAGMLEDYERRCELKEVRLGEPYLYEVDQFTKIVMFPTKTTGGQPPASLTLKQDWTISVNITASGASQASPFRPSAAETAGLSGRMSDH